MFYFFTYHSGTLHLHRCSIDTLYRHIFSCDIIYDDVCLENSFEHVWFQYSDNKVHVAQLGPTWGRQDPMFAPWALLSGYVILANPIRLLPLSWFNINPGMENNYIHYKVWDEIAYPVPNFKVAYVEVWEWIRHFITYFTGHVITYPCWDLS